MGKLTTEQLQKKEDAEEENTEENYKNIQRKETKLS